jgi:hypothetical protein
MKLGSLLLLLAVHCQATSSEDQILSDTAETELTGSDLEIYMRLPRFNVRRVLRAAENAFEKIQLADDDEFANANHEPHYIHSALSFWLDTLARSKLTDEQLEESVLQQLENLIKWEAVGPVTLGALIVAMAEVLAGNDLFNFSDDKAEMVDSSAKLLIGDL